MNYRREVTQPIKKEIVYKGKTYSSYTQLAKEQNVPYQSLQYRLQRGATIEDALEGARQAKARHKPVHYDGVNYDSYAHLTRDLGLSYENFTNRIYKGMSVDEAVQDLQACSKVIFEGKEYRSLRALAKAHGMSTATLHRRINHGLSIEEAMSKDTTKEYSIGGKRYNSIAAICREFEVSRATLYRRINAGMSIEEAVKKYSPSCKLYEYRGETYTIKELAEFAEVCSTTITDRMDRGWSVEDAVETPRGELPEQQQGFDMTL